MNNKLYVVRDRDHLEEFIRNISPFSLPFLAGSRMKYFAFGLDRLINNCLKSSAKKDDMLDGWDGVRHDR